jgi:hypothetical protein
MIAPGKAAPGTHWIGGWVDPRTGLDDLEKRKFLTLPGLELRPLGRFSRRYTDYAIPAPIMVYIHLYCIMLAGQKHPSQNRETFEIFKEVLCVYPL